MNKKKIIQIHSDSYLRDLDCYIWHIYVMPDLTKKEREESKKLREELAESQQAGETDMIKTGRIVKLSSSYVTAGEHRQNKMSASSEKRVPVGVTPTSPQPTEREQAAPEHTVAPESSHHSSIHAFEHQASGLPVAAASPECRV